MSILLDDARLRCNISVATMDNYKCAALRAAQLEPKKIEHFGTLKVEVQHHIFINLNSAAYVWNCMLRRLTQLQLGKPPTSVWVGDA